MEASFESLGAAILWGDIQNAPEGSQVVSVPAYGCYNAGHGGTGKEDQSPLLTRHLLGGGTR